MTTDKPARRNAAREQGAKVSQGAARVPIHDMGHWLDEIMAEAQRRGDFDNLPGKGQPLRLGDPDPFAGPDAMAYRMLKQAGFVPEWVELRKQIVSEIDWLRENPTSPMRPSRIVEVNILIDKHNRQIPNPSLALPKLPRNFGLDS